MVRIVFTIIFIEAGPIRIPHDVDELEHSDKIPVSIPIPFATNTVLPTVTNGLAWPATLEINKPPSYTVASVFCNDIARLAVLLVNWLLPNHVCNVVPVANVFFPK